MQLANQSGEYLIEKISPSDSRGADRFAVHRPWSDVCGCACAAVAALMTALKTGNDLMLWPCVALLVVTGACARSTRVSTRKFVSSLTADDVARWEMRYQFGAMLYAAALGLWCLVALMGSDDAVAHMIAIGHAVLRGCRRRPDLRPAVDLPCPDAAGLRPADVALAADGSPLLRRRWRSLNVLFFFSLKHISTSLQRFSCAP